MTKLIIIDWLQFFFIFYSVTFYCQRWTNCSFERWPTSHFWK